MIIATNPAVAGSPVRAGVNQGSTMAMAALPNREVPLGQEEQGQSHLHGTQHGGMTLRQGNTPGDTVP